MATESEPDNASAEPYDSLSMLRTEHIAKMRAALGEERTDAFNAEIRGFIARVKATGRRLDSSSDRETAQNVIGYWASYLYRGDEPEVLSATLPVLDAFDPTAAPDISNAENPYKGLNPYSEQDAQAFFGRESGVTRVVETLRDSAGILVIGPMGSGKTSFVAAGVVPRLMSRMAAEGEKPVCMFFTPGADPLVPLLANLWTAGAGTNATAQWLKAQKKIIEGAPEQLRALLEKTASGRQAIIVVDQFEEIFTHCNDAAQREAFAKALISLVQGNSNHRLILIVDKRYESTIIQYAPLKPLTQSPNALYTLPPLTADEVRRIIEDAAKTVGLRFEDGIVDDIVKDIGGDVGALPALQFTMGKLWSERCGSLITWTAYDRIGRPHEALKRTAEDIYDHLTPNKKEATRQLFLELVQPTIDGGFVRRRMRRSAVAQHDDADDIADVLDRYVDAGLIRRSSSDAVEDDDRYEVAHEALVGSWPRLRDWLQDERASSQKKMQLVALARRWRESGDKRGYLLSDTALSEAEAYAGASSELKEFIVASRRAMLRSERIKYALFSAAIVLFAALTGFLFLERDFARKERQAADVNARIAVLILNVISNEQLTGPIPLQTARALLKLAHELFATLKDSPDLSGLRSDLMLELSDLYVLTGNVKRALGLAEEAKELAVQHGASKGDTEWRLRLAEASVRIGNIKAWNGSDASLQEALQEYETALKLVRNLAAAEPGDPAKQRKIAFVGNKVGDILMMQKKTAEALEYYGKSLEIGEALVRATPSDGESLKVVADAHKRMADLFKVAGRVSEAIPEYEAALAIQVAMTEREPDNDVYQSNLSKSHHQLGEVFRKQGNFPEARQQYEKALAIRMRLAQKDPDNVEWQSAVAHERMSMGELARATDPSKADRHYRAAIDIRKKLAAKGDGSKWPATAQSHIKYADALLKRHAVDAALAELNAAALILKKFVDKNPQKASARVALAESYDRIGGVLKDKNQIKQALANYRLALDVRRRLVASDPGNLAIRRSLAVQLISLGDALLAHDPAGAIECYEKALKELDDAPAAKFGADVEWRRTYADAHEKRAAALMKSRRFDDALADAARAVDVRLEIVGSVPDVQDRYRELALSCLLLQDALDNAPKDAPGDNRKGEALDSLNKGVALIERFASAHADSDLQKMGEKLRKKVKSVQ